MEISKAQQVVFETGTNVGLLAQELFPNGEDATEGSDWPSRATADKTKKLIAGGASVIYEATFVTDNVLVATDILVKNTKGTWDAYEVKSTASVKDTHHLDCAIQYYVISGSSIELNSISLIHINSEYIRQGDLAIQQLFTHKDLTAKILPMQKDIPTLITELEKIEKLTEPPKIEIGPHCTKPYECNFMNHCWKDIPDYSVFDISRIGNKAWDLYQLNILNVKDIPNDFALSTYQKMQVDTAKNGKDIIDKKAIDEFLDQLTFPVYHLDYETINPAIPQFDGTKPFEQTVFQYSIHKQESPKAASEHYEFLADEDDGDPREQFIQNLTSQCGTEGTILVYNIGFERSKTQKLAADFPEYAKDLHAICDRMIDLMLPFKNGHYHTKSMKGSYSIKYVLPALVPELSYADLTIKEGGTASQTFLSMVNGSFEGDSVQTRKALLAYCEMDTFAMVKLLDVLYSVSSNESI